MAAAQVTGLLHAEIPTTGIACIMTPSGSHSKREPPGIEAGDDHAVEPCGEEGLGCIRILLVVDLKRAALDRGGFGHLDLKVCDHADQTAKARTDAVK